MKEKNKLTTFYLIRHGQTDQNIQGLLNGGGSDTSLNTTGKKQAEELTKLLKGIHFDGIISSDLERCIKTVEAIALERNLTIKTAQALREKHYGSYEGRNRQEVKEELSELFNKWERLNDQEKMKFKIYKDGESDEEALTRFIRHLRELAIIYLGKTLLIATHGGIIRYFLIKLGWGTYQEIIPESVKNTAYLKVDSDGIDFFITETYNIKKAKV